MSRVTLCPVTRLIIRPGGREGPLLTQRRPSMGHPMIRPTPKSRQPRRQTRETCGGWPASGLVWKTGGRCADGGNILRKPASLRASGPSRREQGDSKESDRADDRARPTPKPGGTTAPLCNPAGQYDTYDGQKKQSGRNNHPRKWGWRSKSSIA